MTQKQVNDLEERVGEAQEVFSKFVKECGRLENMVHSDHAMLARLVDPVTGEGCVQDLNNAVDNLGIAVAALETKADVLMLRTNMGGILLVLTGLGALARFL